MPLFTAMVWLLWPAVLLADTPYLIANVVLVDGSGAPPRNASVRIAGNRIVEVGDLEATPGESIYDGAGLALAPGFIDTHSHHDIDLEDETAASAALSQGITTIVVGQDGNSAHPLADFFSARESNPATVNVASFAGHNTLRSIAVIPAQGSASEAELQQMKKMLQADLDAGALGLSTGLEYEPGIYSDTEEVLALAKVAAASGGRYVSHMRSEGSGFYNALRELIFIGRRAQIPVHISHLKLASTSLWGGASQVLQVLDQARAVGIDVTADVYPYTDRQSTIGEGLNEDDLQLLMAWRHTNFGSDGALNGAHPRGAGTMPRILGRYVRELQLMPLESAVHKATALAAQHAGIAGRGYVRPGYFADLVLFDPNAIVDNATLSEPASPASGIEVVWVNGVLVLENAEVNSARPGRVIRRTDGT